MKRETLSGPVYGGRRVVQLFRERFVPLALENGIETAQEWRLVGPDPAVANAPGTWALYDDAGRYVTTLGMSSTRAFIQLRGIVAGLGMREAVERIEERTEWYDPLQGTTGLAVRA